MRSIAAFALMVGLAFSSGCGKKSATAKTGPQATVTLTDGSGFAGTVTASSPQSITLIAPNGESRTYPMSSVASVQYAQSQAPVSTQPAASAAPAVAAVPEAAPAAAPPAQSAPPAEQAPPPAPVEVVSVVPAGSRLLVRNNETIDSKTAAAGQTYSGVVVQSVRDTRGRIVIPHGAPATLVVRSVTDQGHVQGQSELALDIDSVRIDGKRYRVETANVVERGKPGVGENKRTGKFIGGGAVLGTLLGAVAGGGRGAAIGALSGAAAGTATQAVTRGHGVRVPAETVMTFRLEQPIHVREER